MRSTKTALPTLLLLGEIFPFLPLICAEETSELDDVSAFCLNYAGEVHVKVELSDSAPDINLNGSEACPRVWPFYYTGAATLKVCPPKRGTEQADTKLLDIDFRLSPEKAHPNNSSDADTLDKLHFINNILVTNDSVSGPFPNGAEPATIKPVEQPPPMDITDWLIRGTEKSLFKAPEAFSGENTTIGCNHHASSSSSSNSTLKACISMQNEEQIGCRLSQTFHWDMEARFNYTFEIGSLSSDFALFGELEDKDEDGKGLGSYSNATFKFDGDALKSNFRLTQDEDGMLVVQNRTNDDHWYSTGNHTFSTGAGSTVRSSGMIVVVLAMMCAVLLG